MSNWENSRPILDSLPEKGYQDNDVAISLTAWIDEKLSDKATQLQHFYKELDTSTCSIASLDFLAYLVGLNGSYWDTAWSESTKRTLIANAHGELWQYRGTTRSLSFVLDTHKIQYSIWTDTSTIMSFRMPKVMGSHKLRFFLRLPVSYSRDGWHWKEAQRTAKNFAPAIVGYSVCHELFRTGFSRLGEPMFKESPFKSAIG